MKKSMKNNYYDDPNKLMNQPGRPKYHPNETSYYTGNRDWMTNQGEGQGGSRGEYNGRNQRGSSRGGGNFGGNRQGQGFRGGYKNYRDYIDYDDPNMNQQNSKKKEDDRGQVDYSDLFG